MGGIIGVNGKQQQAKAGAMDVVILPSPNTEIGKRALKLQAAISSITTGRAALALMQRAIANLDRADATELEKGELTGHINALRTVENKLNMKLREVAKMGKANR